MGQKKGVSLPPERLQDCCAALSCRCVFARVDDVALELPRESTGGTTYRTLRLISQTGCPSRLPAGGLGSQAEINNPSRTPVLASESA